MEYLVIAITIALVIQSWRASHWKMMAGIYKQNSDFFEKSIMGKNDAI